MEETSTYSSLEITEALMLAAARGNHEAVEIAASWKPFFNDGSDPAAAVEAARAGRIVYPVAHMPSDDPRLDEGWETIFAE